MRIWGLVDFGNDIQINNEEAERKRQSRDGAGMEDLDVFSDRGNIITAQLPNRRS